MPRLTDPWFDAKFYGKIDAAEQPFSLLDSIDGAQGVMLWCPCGYGKAEFPLDGARLHAILVPFANPRNAPPVPDSHGPVGRDKKTRPRWTMTGTCLDDLTVTPSIAVGEPECWHGFLTLGEVK